MAGLSVFRSRFFWKLYASYVLLVGAISAGTGVVLYRNLEGSLMQQVEESLRKQDLLLGPLAVSAFGTGVPDLQQQLVALGRDTGVRISFILPEGRVLADSAKDPAVMENHAARPEVRQSLAEPFGTARRVSRTTGVSLLYLARTLREDGRVLGTVRLALPLERVEARLADFRGHIVLAAALGLLLALLLGLAVGVRTTRPVVAMTRVAAGMRRGDYSLRLRRLPGDEIGLLGRTLNELGAEITKRIATISRRDARLRAILAGIVEGVLAVGSRDELLFANRAARELLGIPQRPAEGARIWEWARLPGLQELLEEARRCAGPVRREILSHRGKAVAVLAAFAAPFEGGGQSGVVMVLHDVTDLRRLEQIRSEFVANVSHELKTPLTSIGGFVETLLDGALEDPAHNRRFLEKIGQQVERLTLLVSDLLSLARIESQGGHWAREGVDWLPLAREAAALHEDAARRSGLDLGVEAPEAPVRVLGDREAMTRILDNLLDNAIHYTPSGGSVRVRLRAAGGQGLLEVEDTGLGIPRADRDRIFERFYRVDKARSRDLGGTGLGLSIVKHLVQALDGTVEVESEEGAGSCFRVSLPSAE